MNLEHELMPCPFCGGEPEFISELSESGEYYYIKIRCGNDECPVSCSVSDLDQTLAAKAWNTRPAAPKQ